MSEKRLLQHFSAEEREFGEKVIDICRKVEEKYVYQLLTFLNPRQEAMAVSLASHFGLLTFSSRDLIETELTRLIIAPSYYQLDSVDFEISLLEIVYNRKFHQLSHSQVLGTLLHQLGIQRQYIGDIVIGEDASYLMIDQRFLPLLKQDVEKIARVPVKWREQDWPGFQLEAKSESERIHCLLSSLRLDKIVAVAFHIPRSKAVGLIETGRVKLDYVTEQEGSKSVEIGQWISVRGFGRVRLASWLGLSKQGKHKVEIDRIRK